ncbi:lipopolysaccharide biosynthesis protein [Paenibacillus marinisediminis]
MGGESVRSLRVNIAWTFMGNVVYAACQWATIAVMAKWGGAETVGLYALALAVSAPIFMFTNLQLRTIQATDAARQFSFENYVALRLMMLVLAMLIMGGILIVNPYSREAAIIILLVSLSKGIEAISDVIYGLLQQRERLDLISKSLLLRGPITLLVMASLFWSTGSLIAGVAGMCIAWLLLLLLVDMRYAAQHHILRWSRAAFNVRALLKLSLPLGIVMMIISLNDALPRYFIEHYLGVEMLGIYSSLAYFIVAGSTVLSAIGQSASPRLAKYYAQGEYRQYFRLLSYMGLLALGLGVAGICAAMWLGSPLLALLYTPQFAAYSPLLVLLMGYGAVLYMASTTGYGMSAARKFRIQPYLFALTFAVSLISQWLLIPKLGIEGAVYALMIVAGVQTLASGIVIIAAVRRNREVEKKAYAATAV